MKRPVFNLKAFQHVLYLATLTLSLTVQAETVRVNISSEGVEANDHSYFQNLSHDGRYVTFISEADNLVPGDTNGVRDVFAYDRKTGNTKRVSVATDGTEANSWSGSEDPRISSDGRYIVFNSLASNLVPGDSNRTRDVFVHDVQSRVTQRVSVASDGSEANGGSSSPDISADGRYVSFESFADNLVPGDTNGLDDIFVHDIETGLTTRVNVASDGTEANAGNFRGYWGWWYTHPISADGRYVAFSSLADNLVTGDENNCEDVFVHNRQTGVTQRVSISSTGEEGNQTSLLFDMSADGRFVIFSSGSTNLSPDGDGGLFLHDRDTGETTLIDRGAWYASISDNGRYVAFSRYDYLHSPVDSNGEADIFVFDRYTERVMRASSAYNGGQTNDGSFGAAISGDGKYVGFDSSADNLVLNDDNGVEDVFVTENPLLFLINPGLNDAWYNPATDGQGFFITVFPKLNTVSLAWFTYDTELPMEGATANLGDPGHRWLTAMGPIEGNQAIMEVEMTSGGLFDAATVIERTDPPGTDGTIVLTFNSCNSGTVEYYMPSINRQGKVPIRRVAIDNIVICEALGMD